MEYSFRGHNSYLMRERKIQSCIANASKAIIIAITPTRKEGTVGKERFSCVDGNGSTSFVGIWAEKDCGGSSVFTFSAAIEFKGIGFGGRFRRGNFSGGTDEDSLGTSGVTGDVIIGMEVLKFLFL